LLLINIQIEATTALKSIPENTTVGHSVVNCAQPNAPGQIRLTFVVS